MNRLVQNIIDQMKEAQIKLGYSKETMRFYYQLSSLNRLLKTNYENAKEAVVSLNKEKGQIPLGRLMFGESKGRVEVVVFPEGSEYVHKHVSEPAFLKDLIQLFGQNPHCKEGEIKEIFEKHCKNYVWKKMEEGSDFDFVGYFQDETIDPYYYCIKMEMGHTIYHRFIKEDYEELL